MAGQGVNTRPTVLTCGFAPTVVAPAVVVVVGVLGQDGLQVPRAEDQQPIGAFGACRAYPPLGKGVRARCRGGNLISSWRCRW
jgi:hypothetical protein